MVRLSCFACRGARFRSSRRHSPTWALPGTGLRTRPRSPLRSSGSRPIRSGLPCIRAGGWSSGSSRGSAETGGCGRTRRPRSPQPEPFFMPPPSCSSSADWPDPHNFRDGLSEGQSDWQLRLFLFLLRSRKLDAFLDHAKADVIERRRLIRAKRIIAVALAHNDFLDAVEDRLFVRFLNADSEELRQNVLPENHLVAGITFDPVEEG